MGALSSLLISSFSVVALFLGSLHAGPLVGIAGGLVTACAALVNSATIASLGKRRKVTVVVGALAVLFGILGLVLTPLLLRLR